MLTANDICWRSVPIAPWGPPLAVAIGNRGTPYGDDRDLCIEQLADDLELMKARAIRAEVDRDSYRELSQLSFGVVAKVSYQRDQAFARLGLGQGDDGERDDQESEDVL